MSKRTRDPDTAGTSRRAINKLTVAGYKSIARRHAIDIRPLTILAGANSSGKSSFMQPLLLWKQTLDASYDPGPLLLNGPNVRFTSFEQLLSRGGGNVVSFGLGSEDAEISSSYRKAEAGIEIVETTWTTAKREVTINPHIAASELMKLTGLDEMASKLGVDEEASRWTDFIKPAIVRDRCFLGWTLNFGTQAAGGEAEDHAARLFTKLFQPFLAIDRGLVVEFIRDVIHISGLRGNPERNYPVTAIGDAFPGTFDRYVASVIAHWQRQKDPRLDALGESLRDLGITWKVASRQIDDTQVELMVGRGPVGRRGGAHDLVSIADVGFGVSQVLPVLVALHAARPGQLVFIEQPEIHLHPRAQAALARLLVAAALRGVQVVVETHSNLLLLGVQTVVARGECPPDLVKLHWFKRDAEGMSEIRSSDLDEAGAFAEDWPEDFAEVTMEAESQFLDAAEARRQPH